MTRWSLVGWVERGYLGVPPLSVSSLRTLFFRGLGRWSPLAAWIVLSSLSGGTTSPTTFYAMLKKKFAMLLSNRSFYFTILIIFHYFNYRYAYASFFNRLCVTYLSGQTSFRVSLRPIVVCPGGVSGIWQEKSCRAVKRAVIYFCVTTLFIFTGSRFFNVLVTFF